MSRSALAIAAVFIVVTLHAADNPLLLEENMQVLKCKKPDDKFRILSASAPGGLFLDGEKAALKLAIAKSDGELAIEIQEITTRDPEARTKGGLTDTSGYAPLIALEGQPVRVPIKPAVTDKPESEIEIADLPLPARFGNYALILVHAAERQFLGTLSRLPKPRENAMLENVPVFGEGQFMNGNIEERAQIFARMGIRGWRSELSWSEDAKGVYQWENLDKLFGAAEKAGCKIMVTLGGHHGHLRPFVEPVPAVGWKPGSGGYGGTGDWVCAPDQYERYGKWITAFCERYWKDGKGPLWGIDNYNEPWEGGGISGWARDCREYRKLQKVIATSAHKVSKDIRMLAASSIMNTEDKLYSDGSNEFDQYVDIFTDHYVVPAMCYGPLVAAAHGKESMETETWIVNAEYMLPMVVSQFMACGQTRIAPWHPRVLFDDLHKRLIPAPVVTATAAFNYFVTGKRFEKFVFLNHLPWVFQFGKDNDPEALLVMFGRLLMAWGSVRERPMAQVEEQPGGTLTIDNADGLLQFFDLAGNPQYLGEKQVKIPMSILPTYIRCAKGAAAAAERIKAAKLEGKRPVEILPHDFSAPVAADVSLRTGVHNCLNRAIKGTLTVTAPEGLMLASTEQSVELAAGETKDLVFKIAKATRNASNAYPFSFKFASDAGDAEYKEVLNAAIICKGTKQIDGNLDDWKDVPGVTVWSDSAKIDPTELMRRPWLAVAEAKPEVTAAEFKLAWDEDNLYLAARVQTPAPNLDMPSFAQRNEDSYFHSAASDEISPYKEFLSTQKGLDGKTLKEAGRSFAEVPYVYCKAPEGSIPFRRDRIHFALDVTDDWHDMKPDTDRVPLGFHGYPDSDYEYSVYPFAGGNCEMWRHLAPGVPRINDFPRQVRGKVTTGLVPGSKCVLKVDGKTLIYEVAIPKSELSTLKLAAGTTVGLMLRAATSKGVNADYGNDKAVTRINGLTLHPYWERKSNCGVRWTLVP
ncbi:MAG TPA: hypothetical protein VGP72_27350 [Planctomycetota bacterium]|jgi:hypothetical protein